MGLGNFIEQSYGTAGKMTIEKCPEILSFFRFPHHSLLFFPLVYP